MAIQRLNGEHHVALVKGDIGDGQDVLCRVHSECLTGDAFGSPECFRMSYATSDENIVEAMRRIKESLAKLK